MITRRETLVSLAALAAASGPVRVLAQTAGDPPKPPKLVETPMFEPLVKEGKLPAIAKRVPAAPLVVKLEGEKVPGVHGGDMRLLMSKDRDARFVGSYGYARLVCWTPDGQLVPDIAEAVEVDEADKTFTIKLRKGHRWSDGKAFTSEDFKFFWEDMANNKALSRYFGATHLIVDGEKPKVEFPDAQTVRYAWTKPNPNFLSWLASPANLTIFRPAHYYKKFHEKYADQKRLEKLNEKQKDGWARKIAREDREGRNNLNPNLPTLDPWVAKTEGVAERYEFTRNPYYHRIDANGRQLPYADRVVMVLAESKIIPVKTGAGEVDLQARSIRFDDFPFLRRAADERGFSVRLWKTANGAQLALYPNLNCAEPVWQKLMRDVRFRRALSLAINRDEINKIMYVGLAEPGQNTVLSASPLYKPELRQAHASFDLVLANRLLDQVGLTQRGSDGQRLLPDGRELELIVEYPAEGTEYIDLMRLVGDTWARAGIKMFAKAFQRVVLRRRVISGQTMMSVWGGIDYALVRPGLSPQEFAPTDEVQAQWPRWGQYYQTSSKREPQGEKPSDPAAEELLKLYAAWAKADTRDARREIWGKMLAIWSDQVFTIGIVGGVLQPVVVDQQLKNVPKEGVYAFDPGAYFGMYKPDTFWFDRAARVHRKTG